MGLKNYIAAILVLWAVSLSVKAGLIISEFAADLSSSSYSASSTYSCTVITCTAENAFNGGQWNAGGTGWHWIQADLGQTQTLTELKLTTAQAPDDFTQHQVFLSDSAIGANYTSLTSIFSRSGFTTSGTILDITLDQAYSGRYLQILVNNQPIDNPGPFGSWTALGDTNGRIDWNQVAPPSSSVPEPSILALMGIGLGGLIFTRRRKAQA